MKELIKKQEGENMRIHMKCLAKAECAKDCGEDTVIKLGYAVSIVEEEIVKVRKETAEAVVDKMTGKVKTKYPELWYAGYNNRIQQEREIKKQILKDI